MAARLQKYNLTNPLAHSPAVHFIPIFLYLPPVPVNSPTLNIFLIPCMKVQTRKKSTVHLALKRGHEIRRTKDCMTSNVQHYTTMQLTNKQHSGCIHMFYTGSCAQTSWNLILKF
jgi:hypothetical protein